jgi:general secretion pathway protein J
MFTGKRAEAGMTLLEVLISVSILVVILAAVYGTYTTSVEAIEIARCNSLMSQSARIIFDRMIKDLESAFVEGSLDLEKLSLGLSGKDQEIDGMPADVIDFTSLAHMSLTREGPHTDLCEIGYYLKKDPTNEGLILYRREDWSVDGDFTEGGMAHEMGRMITALDFVFQDSQGRKHEEWQSLEGEGEPSSPLPSLIQIRLKVKDQLGRERLFTTGVRPMLAELRKDE